jgi:glycosyltransferase involved in cell wall biosynthesis
MAVCLDGAAHSGEIRAAGSVRASSPMSRIVLMTRNFMTVGLLAPPWLPVPPPAYGGIEAVIDQLARGLVAAGHQVALYAPQESTTPVPTAYAAPAAGVEIGAAAVELPHVMRGYEVLGGCDVIHDHTLLGPAWALALGYDRVVTTCHGPLDGEMRAVYHRYGKRLALIAVSRDQAARAPEITIDRVIHHGLDPEQFPVGRGDGAFLLFLGRMAAGKGVREAAMIAHEAGQRLVIAAKMREPAECDYFTRHVMPLLGGNVEFIGEIGNGDKLDLLGKATALLNPIRWPEPFGLVMAEALACGTPVIACPCGAAPEIVDDGLTGFLRAEHDELVRAVQLVGGLDRAACRRAIVARFSTGRMVDRHLSLYRDTVDR